MIIAALKIDANAIHAAIAGINCVEMRHRTCDEYSLHFGRNIDTAPDIADTLQFLAIICSWRLKPDDEQSPYDFVWHESKLDDLTNEQLDVLTSVAPTVGDAELRTRLCDLVWLRKRSHIHARHASEGCLVCIEQLISAKSFLGEREHLKRALQLASLIDRGGDFFHDVVGRIERIAAQPQLPHCTVVNCLNALWNAQCGERKVLCQLAADRAVAIRATDMDLHWERTFWKIASQFAGAKEDSVAHRDFLMEYARTFEREAIAGSKVTSAHFWQLAVNAYRAIPDTQGDRERCHRELLKAQEHLLSTMVPISLEPIDISMLVEQARQRMRGKEKGRALAELVFATRWQEKSYLRRQVEDSFQNYPLQHIFGSVQFGSTGKVAATAPPAAGPSSIASERLHAEMCRQYHTFVPVVVQGTLEPMRNELMLSHNVTLDDIVEFLSCSPLIPPDRILLYAVGIQAGLSGRFIEALHVLIPQLEHLLRYLLSGQNVITSRLNPEGIQEELDLNRLLCLPETEKLLGEDLHFAVRVMFIERFGFNLRNHLSHGMLPSGAFSSTPAVYVWWLILRIVGGPVAEMILQQSKDAAERPSAGSEECDSGAGDQSQ
jgi:hypothetical protein